MTRGRALGVLLATLLISGCAPAVHRPEPEWPPASVLELQEPDEPTVDGPRTTQADALAYVRYLHDEIAWMLRTGFNAGVLRNHECTVCTDLVALADRARDEHLVNEVDDWVPGVEGVQPLDAVEDDDPSSYWAVFLALEQPEIRVLDGHGRQVDAVPARRTSTTLVISEYDGRWYLLEWYEGDRTPA